MNAFLKIACYVTIAIVTFNVSADTKIFEGQTIRTCNDNGEWPPYFWNYRVGDEKTDQVLGYDLDYLEEIFGPIQANFTFELIPWSRCLHEVEAGGAYDMVSSAAFSQERDQKYLVTDSYYTVRPHYFYPKHRFPDGLEIPEIEQFAKYRVCGLRGYNYTNFGVSVESIDVGTHNFAQLIEKTERGRCDVFLGRYEIFAGFAKTGNNYIVKHSLGTAPMPGIPGDKFHMMVSRNYPYAEELRDAINDGIARLKSSGVDRDLLAPYLD